MVSFELKDIFLALVRLGIGNQPASGFKFQRSGEVDWVALKALADRHGLAAIVLDGLDEVRSKTNDGRGVYFDLQGRRVTQPQKGIYIVNGKKVVI